MNIAILTDAKCEAIFSLFSCKSHSAGDTSKHPAVCRMCKIVPYKNNSTFFTYLVVGLPTW